MRIDNFKIKTDNSWLNSNICILQDDKYLENLRAAGKIAARTILLLENLVKEKTIKSLKELNDIAAEFIIQNGGSCTFYKYKGFPGHICISVNQELVHGIPSDRKLVDGDLISFDLGVTINGAIADTATTVIFGEPKSSMHLDLIRSTEEALISGIKAISIGKKIGVIGEAIYKVGRKNNLSVVTNMGGHGITMDVKGNGIPHAFPFIANRSTADEGIRMAPGMVIAIEPLFVLGTSNKTKLEADNWTVSTLDISAHFENTVYIHQDYVEVISDKNEVNNGLSGRY